MPSLARAGSKKLLFTAFGLLLAVLTALIALGIARIESFNAQIHELTAAQGRKIGVVSELFLANGQRVALIDRMFAAEKAEDRQAALVTATVHPSSILREPDSAARRAAMRAFVRDLKRVKTRLAK